MTISKGYRLPGAKLLRMGANGVETVDLAARLAGRKVAIFAVPGAFSSTCSLAHLPSFLRNTAAFAAKGVDEIIGIAVNDPHVLRAWGEATGAAAGGITLLADADGAYTRALGLAFDAPAAGFFGRSRRYAMYVVDGVVEVFNPETGKGCETSAGEVLLAAI